MGPRCPLSGQDLWPRQLCPAPRLDSSSRQCHQAIGLAYKIARRAVSGNIPVVLEQPCASLMLETPEHKRLAKDKTLRHIKVDQCQFGAGWRKRTSLCFWNTLCPYALDVRCCGRNGICDQRNSFHMQGKAPGGRNWTSIAQHYPKSLCNTITLVLLQSSDAAAHAARKLLVA